MISKYYVTKPDAVDFPEGPLGRQVCNLKTVLGRREYARRKEVLWVRQLGRCAICRKQIELEDAQFGHGRARGLGGGSGGAFRDDRLWDNEGKPMNACLCAHCNTRQGSKHYEWRDGLFQPVERIRA